ncbi:MAG: FISUMP domain-containing protein, partial [Bacteroidales bacterium]
MKNLLVSIICGSIVLAATLNSCTKDEEDDFSGPSGTFVDNRDKIEYNWVRIGDQIWMAENLAYLPSVSPSSEGSETEPYYYVYAYDGSIVSEAKVTDNYNAYGVLFNWPAALTACPDGWHLPTDA